MEKKPVLFERIVERNENTDMLINISQQLAYNNEKLEKLFDGEEVLQEDMNELAEYITNAYYNSNEKNDSISPLQDQRDFFNNHIENIVGSYLKGELK